MRFPSLISSVVAALAGIAAATEINATSTSSNDLPPLPSRNPHIELVSHFAVVDGPLATFEFSTRSPHPRNWIGIWHDYYGGPENNTWVQDQLVWACASGTNGTVRVDASGLQPGRYMAYYLAHKSYKWLADPVEVFVPGTGSIRFIPNDFTTHNARVGDAFEADISGLLRNVKDGQTTYSIIEHAHASWISISGKGVINGTPKFPGLSRFTVQATASDNITTAIMPVAVYIKGRKKPLTNTVKVLTWNTWLGGRNVNDYHRKQVTFLAGLDVDIVALQETYSQDGLRLAKALGWHAWQSKDVSIITRYPIAEVYREVEAGGIVRIALDGQRKQVIVWNVHLNNAPYGPYDLCFTNYSTNYVQRREEWSRRHQQIFEVVRRMDEFKLRKEEFVRLPHILAGDFCSPSHLDWIRQTKHVHCQDMQPFPWPVTRTAMREGHWKDSFRQMHPNSYKIPGYTWSPIHKRNGERVEPMDRIDYIYHQKLKPIVSRVVVVDTPKIQPYHADNEWTSDHAAVFSEFRI